jgi:cellulose biosynthesis protein BcsQ
MEKETLFVAFSTQKGGMGKTAMTVLTASYLNYAKGYHVAVIDCDYPQHSIVKERNRDYELIINDMYFKRAAYEQFRSLGIKAYPVRGSMPKNAIEDAQKLIESSEKPFDVIFFDLPGTLNSDGVLKTLASMDYIFTPISADRFTMESTLQFATLINDSIITVGKGRIKSLRLFWNMVDGREKTRLYEVYESAIDELGLSIMKTMLPNSVRFRKEMSVEHGTVFRSTVFSADKILLKGSGIEELANEICQITSLNSQENEKE